MQAVIAKKTKLIFLKLFSRFLKESPVTWVPFKWLLAPVAAVALGGCAIHPVQQDVTHVPTNKIVRRIRCEARLAVLDKAVEMMRQRADDLVDESIPTSALALTHRQHAEKLRSLARSLAAQRGGAIKFNPRDLPTPAAQMFYDRYINTAIAYDFLFNITEGNTAVAAVDPVRLITNGTVGVTLGASGSLTRNNQRGFTVTDHFGDLLADEGLRCESLDYLPENYIYPIAGAVGLRGAIDTFINLYEDRPLTKRSDKTSVFADTLQFTTDVSAGVGPHAQIDPVGIKWGLASPASLKLGASRTDVHTLTVGLAMGPPGKTAMQASRAPRFSLNGFSQRPRVVTTRSNNEQSALQAIDDLRFRSFLERAGTLR